jgi:hypothetical protein
LLVSFAEQGYLREKNTPATKNREGFFETREPGTSSFEEGLGK